MKYPRTAGMGRSRLPKAKRLDRVAEVIGTSVDIKSTRKLLIEPEFVQRIGNVHW